MQSESVQETFHHIHCHQYEEGHRHPKSVGNHELYYIKYARITPKNEPPSRAVLIVFS
jgi:hypothetical protein